MTNVSVVEKISELMQQIEVNSPRVAALHYCLSESARHIAELEKKLVESQREFRAADATIENLQMQVEKLAAENAGLKAAAIFLADEAAEIYRRWNLIQQPDGDIIDMQTISELKCACHETPTTDAFLAEVRVQAKADGVQEYADSFRHSASKIRECHGDTIRVRALMHEANNADEFAAKLRKGVQP